MGKTNLPILKTTMDSKYKSFREANFKIESDFFSNVRRSVFFTSNIEYEDSLSLVGSRVIVKEFLQRGRKKFKNKSIGRSEKVVSNFMEALQEVQNWDTLNITDLKVTHFELCKEIMDQGQEGEFRKGIGTINNREDVIFVEDTLIESELTKLIEEYANVKSKTTDKEKLFEIFNWKREFIRIHPFADGNGRMSRLILQWMLHNEGFYVPTFRGWSRKDYHDGMNLAFFTRDMRVARDMYLQEVIVSKLLEDNYETIKDLIPPTLMRDNSEYVEDYFYDNFESLREMFGWDKTLRIKSYK